MSAASRAAFEEFQRELVNEPDYRDETYEAEIRHKRIDTMTFKKMSAKGSGGIQPPTGTNIAICYGVVDVGFQETKFGMKENLYLLFELPHAKLDDGRPMCTSKMYTASMHPESNLRMDLESWFGKKFPNDDAAENFDLSKVAGFPCQLSMIENGSFVNVKNIMGLPQGMQAPTRHNEIVIYSMDTHSKTDYDRLPEWLRKKIDAGRANQPGNHLPANGTQLPAFAEPTPMTLAQAQSIPQPPPQEWRVNAPVAQAPLRTGTAALVAEPAWPGEPPKDDGLGFDEDLIPF